MVSHKIYHTSPFFTSGYEFEIHHMFTVCPVRKSGSKFPAGDLSNDGVCKMRRQSAGFFVFGETVMPKF